MSISGLRYENEGAHARREALPPAAAALGAGAGQSSSSYDALPIPPEQLREWREATVARIRELPRRRVLEIGAGAGHLMERVARGEEVHEYWATDACPAAVAALTARAGADALLTDKVRLRCRGAQDTGGLPAGHFETIVLNSVVQRFTGLARLRTVIEGLLPLLAPGGSLFLDGLRSLDLARCFHTGVALARPGAARGDREALLRAIDEQVAQESELLLAPALFGVLARDVPGVRAVDVRVKRGVHHNELTRYRYEAVLSTAEPVADLAGAPALGWGRDVTDVASVVGRLAGRRPAVLRVAGVPNRRVHDEYAAMRSLFDPREGIDLAPQEVLAPDPEVLCGAVERLGYRALLTWGREPDLLDLLVVDPGQVPAGALSGVCALRAGEAGDCANTPARARAAQAEAVLRRAPGEPADRLAASAR
ncbi:class I SAM-dependent methyltransferase [Streptomyces sp. NPDC005907]|uniref:class I SAM-dependent methyltransferase n=1 Tax=Streptomyces sp. NPDC005907 TaxID=3154571 RepID=UPI0033DC5283